ncbi:MAG: aldehyde ferredoxin oxidoreductase family protein [Nitrososphaerales archaeon]
MIERDPIQKVLYVDLTRRRFWIEERADLFEKYIGGSGVAIKLLLEECRKGADPLGPDNPIIFAAGPLNCIFPMASKTVAMFKSPLTGNLGESHAGGRSGIALRSAGLGALVIKGASDIPIYLSIHDGKVSFRDARVLWGMRSSYTVGRVIRERESSAGLRTIMRIGRAGENLVRYACVITETYRHFGRLGLGAVFGSKKLKAVTIAGTNNIQVRDIKEYKQLYQEIFTLETTAPALKKYHDIGTPMNLIPLNKIQALPAYNLKQASLDKVEAISGENLAKNYLGRRVSCGHCPVSCIHLAALREPYEKEPYFYKTTMISYDYEPIYALGTMLGITSPEGLLKLIDEVEVAGLDAMSCGVALAWATEAQENGLISNKAEGTITQLKWGDYNAYIKAVNYIVEQPNEFYKALAQGVEYAAAKYGGLEYALAFGGNEMPGYHTGPAAHIGYLTGARHSHLDSAGYSLDQKLLASKVSPTPSSVADTLFEEEAWRQILSTLVVCFFSREIYKPEVVQKALKVIGWDLSLDNLKSIGYEILALKHEFKRREGFNAETLRIPKRILETPTPHGKLDGMFIKDAVAKYFNRVQSIKA